MKKLNAAVLAAFLVGSFAVTTNVKADAQRVIVTPGYGVGYGYGWRRHNFYRAYANPWYGGNYWRYRNWQARRGFGWHRGWY